MIPHILRSISHASRNGAEIYVPQPRDRLLDFPVSQREAESSVHGADLARAVTWHAQLTGERLDRGRAFRWARDYGAAVRFAEQQLRRRKSYAVRRKINVQTESMFRKGSAHRDLRERDA